MSLQENRLSIVFLDYLQCGLSAADKRIRLRTALCSSPACHPLPQQLKGALSRSVEDIIIMGETCFLWLNKLSFFHG